MSADKLILAVQDHTQRLYDYASSTITYVGVSASNAKETASAWRIKRITYDNMQRPIREEYARGNSNLSNKWSNRTTITYGI